MTQDTQTFLNEDLFNEQLIPAIEEAFVEHYTCTSPWSAWVDKTMIKNDFIPFDREDDLFQEIYIKFKEAYKSNPTLDVETVIQSIFDEEQVDVLHNKDLENCFNSDSFEHFSWDRADVSPIIRALSDYQSLDTCHYKTSKKQLKQRILSL